MMTDFGNSMRTYDLYKDSQVFLYGAATMGVRIYRNMSESGYKICGFIDKRADEIEQFMGLPVFNKDNLKFNEELIIIISVKNVFEHESICAELLELGFEKIIYVPYAKLVGGASKEQELIGDIYSKIEKGQFLELKKIPFAVDCREQILTKDYAYIKKNDTSIVAYVPIELIYTNFSANKNDKWCNIPIASFYPHILFFWYLEGKNEGTKDYYLDFCSEAASKTDLGINKSERWKQNVIKNRSIVYEQMTLAVNLDFDFFIRSAPTAEWNDRGYFNLTSGKHRATFLVSKGYQYVPLRISTKDYETWINIKKLNDVIKLISGNGRLEVGNFVPHPMFYRSVLNSDINLSLLSVDILMFMLKYCMNVYGNTNLSKLCVLDATNSVNAITRMLLRGGAKTTRWIKMKEDNISTAMNELQFGVENEIIRELNNAYDVVICDLALLDEKMKMFLEEIDYKQILYISRDIINDEETDVGKVRMISNKCWGGNEFFLYKSIIG